MLSRIVWFFFCSQINVKMSDPNSSANDLNLSLVAGNIVSNAVQAIRHLFCPFCGERSLFEHTLKTHLKAMHPEQLEKYTKSTATHCIDANEFALDDDLDKQNLCTFCGAMFLHAELLPKHIVDYHGNMCFKVWQQQQQCDQNKDSTKLIEPTIVYAHCSPGLSELFDNISTNDDIDGAKSPLKSILKKSNMKSAAHRIICSPSSAGIRRTKNTTLVRRSSSARRELRFDFSDENYPLADCVAMPKVKISREQLQTKKRRSHGCLMSGLLFGRCVSSRKKKITQNIVTSTPNNFLDECDAMEDRMNDKYWNAIIRGQPRNNKPLFSRLERFQCAHCKCAWENNADLLTHLNEKHKHVRRWFQADYRCGTCAAKFYSNRFLVRHCHAHHTPVKRLR